jgi:hypothetical protein
MNENKVIEIQATDNIEVIGAYIQLARAILK